MLSNPTTPYIPNISPSQTNLEAAHLYIDAGLFILPVQPGTKNPGSVVGSGWPEISSNDPDMINFWFKKENNYGIALHAGKSNLVIFDVDHPESMPQVLLDAIASCEPPIQQTRPDTPQRGHYLFSQPQGRMLGNSAGALARGWGEVRGKNGVIIVSPTIHPDGGEYKWIQTGNCPEVPSSISQHILDSGPTARAVNGIDVENFLAEYTAENKPFLLKAVIRRYTEKVMLKTFSRHEAMLDHLCWAFQEAKAGFYPAKVAYRELLKIFISSLHDDQSGSGRSIDQWQAEKEFQGLVKWAIGQVNAIPDSKLHERALKLMDADEDKKIKEEVQRTLTRMKIRQKAKQEFDAESWEEPTDGGRMDEVLTEEHKSVPHRIDGLGKVGGNITLAGKYKSGKTTLEQNLIRSLVDDIPFLGRELVTPLEGNVGVFNYELDSDEFLDWLRSLKIINAKKVFILNLRGKNLPLCSEHAAEWTAKWLAKNEIEYWIIDPAARALGNASENSNDDVVSFTNALDAIKERADVRDLLLLTHTGRSDGSRSRGATRWDDWPDALWNLEKRDNKRFFSAYGRRVDIEEMELSFDPDTLRLSPVQINSRDEIIELANDLANEVRKIPGKKAPYYELRIGNDDSKKITKFSKENAFKVALELGIIKEVVGNMGGVLYFPPEFNN